MEPAQRKEGLLPWMSAIGLGLLLISLIAIINGGSGGILAVVGAVLFVGGLIRRSIERTRQASS